MRQPTYQQYFIIFLAVNGLLLMALLGIQWAGFENLLDSEQLFKMDGNHYRVIRDMGYRGHNIAFFPLAPYLWRYLSLDGYGIVIFHAGLYGISAAVLARTFAIPLATFALLACLPNAFFLLLPYSEAVFFIGAVIALIGLHRDRLPIILLGLFWCTLTRPAFTIFFPALLITEYVQDGINRRFFLRIAAYAVVFAIAATLVAWLQWLDTGQWFGYFGIQKDWGNFLQVPQLPLRSWGGRDALLLDAAALLIGLVAMGFVVQVLLRRLKGTKGNMSPATVFAISYLAGISFVVLIFRGGSLFSLNRFVFATPFAWLAIAYFLEQRRQGLNWKPIALTFLGVLLYTFLFRSFVHLQTLLIFASLALWATLLVSATHTHEGSRRITRYVATALQFGFLVFACFRLLQGNWIA